MAGAVTYQCPCCDAGLIFDAEKQLFCCEFCLSEFSESELAQTDTAQKAEEKQKEQEEFCSQMNEYHCPNCGAEIIVDENTAADFCYYCHNPVILAGKLAGDFKPDKVVPFKYDKEQAQNVFLTWAKKHKFVPNDFFAPKQIEQIQGIYYPFWVTDADTVSEIDARGERVRSWSSGNFRYTETSHFKFKRRGNIHFEDVVTTALSDADKAMLEGVLPFPPDADVHKDFSMAYLSGFHTKKRNLARENVNGEVKQRIDKYATDILRGTIERYSSVRVDKTNVRIKRSTWEYTLMPVWVLTYKDKKGKIYTFALNGYTGKIYGQLPISFYKMLILAASLVASFGTIFSLIGGFLL